MHGGGALPPLVVLVHGAGGLWWTLRHQLTALAEAGFHAVALDQRGHGDSDKPPRGYDAWTLSADVTNLVRALGHSRAVLVGQGEGAMVAWTAAYRRPRAVSALATIGSGHPLAVRRAVLRDGVQRAALLPGLLADQTPRLAERRLTADGARAVEDRLRDQAGPLWVGGGDFVETAALLRRAMLIPKVAHLTLESRRWLFRSQFRIDGRDYRRTIDHRLGHPVLAIHGTEDRYILPSTVLGSAGWSRDFTPAPVPGAGHFPAVEAPEHTSRLLVDFAERHGTDRG